MADRRAGKIPPRWEGPTLPKPGRLVAEEAERRGET